MDNAYTQGYEAYTDGGSCPRDSARPQELVTQEGAVMKVQDTFWKICALLAFVLALGIVGNSDLEEAERQEAEYCANVKSGTWPDFDANYKERCIAHR